MTDAPEPPVRPGSSDPSSPSEVPQQPELPELLMAAARALRRSWWSALEPHGLNPHQARALRAVTGTGTTSGGLRVSDLAAALRIAPRSATEVADGLEEHGLVVRAADPSDRRAVVLRATDEGRSVARRVEAARAASGEALLHRLGERDRADLVRLLRLVVDEPGAAGVEDPQLPPARTTS